MTFFDGGGDRPVSFSRSLLWTMATGIIAAAIYIGVRLQQLEQVVQDGQRREARIAAIEARVQAGELDRAVTAAQVSETLRLVERIDRRLERIEAGGSASAITEPN